MNKELRKKLKESAKEAGMELKDYLINNNYCVDCGEKFEPIAIRFAKGAVRDRRICRISGDPGIKRYSMRCSHCLKVARDRNRQYKIARDARRRDEGMCIQCGKNPPTNAAWTVGYYIQTRVTRPSDLCTECRDKNARKRSEYHYYYPRDYNYHNSSRGYYNSDYIERVKEAGLCIRCKGRSGLRPKYPYYTCEHCREEVRKEARERYVPAYPMKFFKSLKVGDKFPLTRTTKGRPEYKQGVITSIDKDPDGNIDRINLNIGHYDLYQEHGFHYRRMGDKFNFKFVKELE